MKKGLIFFLGIVTGVVLSIATISIITYSYSEDSKIKLYENPTTFDASKFEILQVFEDGALARCTMNDKSAKPFFYHPIVYIMNDGENLFYDEQIIEIPKEKRVLQIGTFRYETRLNEKVVPLIEIQ